MKTLQITGLLQLFTMLVEKQTESLHDEFAVWAPGIIKIRSINHLLNYRFNLQLCPIHASRCLNSMKQIYA